MTLEEVKLAIKYHNDQIEISKLALQRLFVIREEALQKENGQISIDDLEG